MYKLYLPLFNEITVFNQFELLTQLNAYKH